MNFFLIIKTFGSNRVCILFNMEKEIHKSQWNSFQFKMTINGRNLVKHIYNHKDLHKCTHLYKERKIRLLTSE